MEQSTAHTAAVAEAVRAPALQARLDMLAQGEATDPAQIDLYDGTPPDPGDTPAGVLLVSIALTSTVGTVIDEVVETVRSVRLELDAPIEGQVADADPATGSIPTWGRILTPAGDWWADITVSVEGGDGELQLAATGTEGEPAAPVARLFNGAYSRVSSFVIEG